MHAHRCQLLHDAVLIDEALSQHEDWYCAMDEVDRNLAQLDFGEWPHHASVKLNSATLPVNVPIPQLTDISGARVSEQTMLARIAQALDGLHDLNSIATETVPSEQLQAELCEILQMGPHAKPFAAATLSQHLPAWSSG